MIKEAIGYGSTIDEARENAVALLNAAETDDIQFEVLATPKKKTLGLFGGRKAEVRVFVELPDEKPAKPARENRKKKPTESVAAGEKPRRQEKPVKAAAPAKAGTENSEQTERTERAQRPARPAPDFGELRPVSELPADSKAARATAYLKSILDGFGCTDIEMKVAATDNAALIALEGESVGVIIGHRGETLDSLQYLTSLAASNGGGYFKITLNIGNYREKREEALISLAKRVSAQVIKTGRCRSLEPMNPYERRVIHTAVQAIDGVSSSSYGQGSARRVIIGPEGEAVRPPKRNSYGVERRRPSAHTQPAPAPDREPKRDNDAPLYGKIN